MSVAQSFGTLTPATCAARMTDVPAGTSTVFPSICSATVTSLSTAGVP